MQRDNNYPNIFCDLLAILNTILFSFNLKFYFSVTDNLFYVSI